MERGDWRCEPEGRRKGTRPPASRMIEALIAAAILLIIALGLMPLFTRSINDNVSGNDATQATTRQTSSRRSRRCRSTMWT